MSGWSSSSVSAVGMGLEKQDSGISLTADDNGKSDDAARKMDYDTKKMDYDTRRNSRDAPTTTDVEEQHREHTTFERRRRRASNDGDLKKDFSDQNGDAGNDEVDYSVRQSSDAGGCSVHQTLDDAVTSEYNKEDAAKADDNVWKTDYNDDDADAVSEWGVHGQNGKTTNGGSHSGWGRSEPLVNGESEDHMLEHWHDDHGEEHVPLHKTVCCVLCR